MRAPAWLTFLLALGAAAPLNAQRPFRIGAAVSSITLEDQAGTSHSFTSYGGSVALITSDESETGLTIARYNDLSTDGRLRNMTLFGLDAYYYPIGARGIAPFATTELGLARVRESASPALCLVACQDTVSATNQFAIGFGLGVRVTLADAAVGLVEGRFLEVPGSAIQALEARASAAVALGSIRKGAFLEGTVGPTLSAMIPLSGPWRAREPFLGVRFRRDTKKATVGLQIDFAPLQVSGSCTPPGCQPNAILFAPSYEPSLRTAWGRLYAGAGLLLAGIYTQGPDRGIAQGAHGGFGADILAGRLMWNVNARLLWLQRNTGENSFGIQLGASLAPAIGAGH